MMDHMQELSADEAAMVSGGDGDTLAEFMGFAAGYYARQVYDWITAPPIQFNWAQK